MFALRETILKLQPRCYEKDFAVDAVTADMDLWGEVSGRWLVVDAPESHRYAARGRWRGSRTLLELRFPKGKPTPRGPEKICYEGKKGLEMNQTLTESKFR